MNKMYQCIQFIYILCILSTLDPRFSLQVERQVQSEIARALSKQICYHNTLSFEGNRVRSTNSYSCCRKASVFGPI